MTWFEEIHRNLAILPLHSESRALGSQRAGGRQRVDFGILGVGWRLHLYRKSSFDEIKRNSSKSGNIATTKGIEGPGSSASKGLILAFRCRMTIKSVQIVEFCLNWKKSFENWQYCHYTLNQVPWVLNEQVGDKGCRITAKSV